MTPRRAVRQRSVALLALAILIFFVARRTTPPSAPHSSLPASLPVTARQSPAPALIQTAFGNLPLAFEVNQGQTDKRVHFLSHGSGYSLFLTGREAVFALKQGTGKWGNEEMRKWGNGGTKTISSSPHFLISPMPNTQHPTPTAVLRMQLVGANPAPQAKGEAALSGKVNYLHGNDPKKWRKDVPTYGKVRYKEVYRGVDLVYYGNRRQLEYDFVVAPGADPSRIALSFAGAQKLRVEKTGELVIGLPGGEVRWERPVVYQPEGGKRKPVSGAYVVRGREVGFQVARYDTGKPLVIDPVLVYSTYLGGNFDDVGNAITLDTSGNVYVVGATRATNFPATPGAFQTTLKKIPPPPAPTLNDAFVAKLNPSGTAILYATYVGGDIADAANTIAVDSGGNAYVGGTTESTNFPTTTGVLKTGFGGKTDGFLFKLNATGDTLIYSTYIGGGDIDTVNGVAIDGAGNAYLTGRTNSTDFPVKGAYQSVLTGGKTDFSDAYISELNPTGTAMLYSTYLGGTDNDQGNAITLDASGMIYVTGQTSSSNFPTTSGALREARNGPESDAFVAKFNPLKTGDKSRLYVTYLGGSSPDFGLGIVVDANNIVYVTGQTGSANFPVTESAFMKFPGGFWDAFVSVLDLTKTGDLALLYSTYIGGSKDEFVHGIALGANGNVYLIGQTFSFDLPVTNNAAQSTLGAGTSAPDTFLAQIDTTRIGQASCVYLTYAGGRAAEDGRGIVADSAGNVYITGSTTGNFPTTAGALQTTFGGNTDAIVFKFKMNTSFDLDGDGKPDLVFQNQTNGNLTYWLMNGGVQTATGSFSANPGTPDLKAVGFADFNGDGHPDILFQSQTTSNMYYWFLNGTTVIASGPLNPSNPTTPSSTFWKVVGTPDLNGDGHPDILFQRADNGDLAYWLMNGITRLKYGYINPANPGLPTWKVIGTGDINYDGKPDILFQRQDTGELAYWQMDGINRVKYGWLFPPNPGLPWRVMAVSDFNKDGKTDILFQHQSTGELVYWPLNGITLIKYAYLNPTTFGAPNVNLVGPK